MNRKNTARDLWGEGVPYSQVYLTKEIRILGSGVSREYYYITTDINPGSYDALLKNRDKIGDADIQVFLQEAEFDTGVDGYKWSLYFAQVDTVEESEVQEVLKAAVEKVIKLHKTVIKLLNIDEMDF